MSHFNDHPPALTDELSGHFSDAVIELIAVVLIADSLFGFKLTDLRIKFLLFLNRDIWRIADQEIELLSKPRFQWFKEIRVFKGSAFRDSV